MTSNQDDDLAARLDGAIPHPTGRVDTAATLRAGRRALRRRRVATTVSSVAAVAVLGAGVTGVALAAGGPDAGPTAGPGFAVSTPAPPSDPAEPCVPWSTRTAEPLPPGPGQAEPGDVDVPPWADSDPYLDNCEQVAVPEGTRIVERVDDPLDAEDGTASWAFAYTAPEKFDGTRWAILWTEPGSGSERDLPPGVAERDDYHAFSQFADAPGGETFPQWVRRQARDGAGS